MAKMLVWAVCAVVAAASGAGEPAEWAERDIGDCKLKGSMLFDQETSRWVVRAGGADIWGNADSFHFVYKQLKGDGSIMVRVENLANTHESAKIGVMMRESLEPGSMHVLVTTHFNGAVALQRRTETGGATVQTSQPGLRAPYWLRLTRAGNQFIGERSKDGLIWQPIPAQPSANSPSDIELNMPETLYIGLAMCGRNDKMLCEAHIDHVAMLTREVTDTEIHVDMGRAVRKAYRNLSQLGNWREKAAVKQNNQNVIASSLIAISKADESGGTAPPEVLAGYYRIVELVPDAPLTVNALSRIAILDRDKGLLFATKQLERKSQADRDAFYLALIRDCLEGTTAQENTLPIKWFVEYAGTRSDTTLLEDALRLMDGATNETALRKGLIQSGMAQPATERIAIATLRSVAVKADNEKRTAQVLETAKWAAGQFPDSKLSVCAKTVLADAEYDKGHYLEALRAFQPGLLVAGQSESKAVEMIDSSISLYRAGAIRSDGAMVGDHLYAALAQRALESGMPGVAAHCYRKLAEMKGFSTDSFVQSAKAGTRLSGGPMENDMWFWKGWLAALEGDPMIAVQAYGRFLMQDDRSILAAKAYYDLARIKMTMGENARDWVAKAKAISPCQEVRQLESRLSQKGVQ